ncbi:uncharacterized protein LOC129284938 [Prosopis cineraria]|uniref:uncharacterized protein LOC129284938 n=1 Tax=Prosopis cineraria TaxID=364024 RepID=UPI00240EA203|nr:uncharacterized protein LOC129284938 [Prosopis cineraria]
MGNCCRKTSSMEWAGDDWGSLRSSSSTRSSKVFDEDHAWPEKKQLLGACSSSDRSNKESGKVTIKISKKELEELMRGLGKKEREGRSASAEQVLVRLLSARDHHHHAQHGPWRPVLQSIPELD